MTLRTVLLSLQALMAAAEPDDPQDAVVAKQYKEYPEIFAKTASHWTNVYAGGIILCNLNNKITFIKNTGLINLVKKKYFLKVYLILIIEYIYV